MRKSITLLIITMIVTSSVRLGAEPTEWQVMDGGNGHYYEFVEDPRLWTEAYADALTRIHLGYQGHLVTITSRGEQDFLNSIKPSSGDAWLGGSDAAAEGVWRWVAGPENGQLMADSFLNWASGEPNNFMNEDYLIGWWREGDGDNWNDGSIDRYRGYVVEYSVPPLRIMHPNGGETFLAGTTQLIEWDNYQTEDPNVVLEFSIDEGLSWSNITTTANNGEYEWEVPTVTSNQCLIKIEYVNDPVVMDTSDDVFTTYECQEDFLGDLNNDCFIDLLDFALFANDWLRCGNPFNPECSPYNIKDGLVGYWDFDEGEGDIAHDLSGNDNHGTILGASFVDGISGKALYFDGVNDYVLASADNLPTGERTVSLWFYADIVTNKPVILGYGGDGSGTSWFMGCNFWGQPIVSMSCHWDNNTIKYYYPSEPIGEWLHFVVTTDVSGTKIYINGEEKAANNIFVDNTIIANTDLSFGVCVSSTGQAPYADGNIGYFKGIIDSIRIYDRMLSESEIQYLYQYP